MKKILPLLGLILLFSCTENQRARNFGGEEHITLSPNEKLINMTWKQDDLWILTSEADSNFVPTTYKFQEKSSYGVMEGTITVQEAKTDDNEEVGSFKIIN